MSHEKDLVPSTHRHAPGVSKRKISERVCPVIPCITKSKIFVFIKYFKNIRAVKLLILCTLSQQVLFAEAIDPESILQAFRDSYEWTNSVALNIKMYDGSSSMPDSKPEFSCVYKFYNDSGNRMCEKGVIHVTPAEEYGNLPGERFHRLYSKDLNNFSFRELQVRQEDGESFENFLYIHEDGEKAFHRDLAIGIVSAGPLLGYGRTFSTKRIPDLLTKDNVAIREEAIEGIRHCIVTASLPEGDIELWLDPDKNHVMTKCMMTKAAGKHVDIDGKLFAADRSDGIILKEKRWEVYVSEYKEQDGHYLPLHLESTEVYEYENSDPVFLKNTYTVEHFDLNPNFDALDAFVTDFSENVFVYFRKKDGTLASGFTWKDGKFLPRMDVDALEDYLLRGMAQLTRDKDAEESETSAAVTLQLRKSTEQDTSKRSQSSVFVRVAAVLFVLACGGALALYVSRKGR
ncbi:MAG: hypothetical protein GX130_05490 [Candidatus Hydrogenedens sp.]|jgi:hypothetical protein|nr:hypothetical protein [Candidatus Hydrogenedens sp.]